MKSIQETKQWLLENRKDEFGNLDLSELDLSDFDGDVYINRMKVNKDSFQKDLSPTLIMRHIDPYGYEIYNEADNIVEKFDENNPPKNYSNVLFSSEEEAQKYCDYLNSLKEEKEDE